MRLKALKEVRERLDGRGVGGFLKNKTKVFAMLVGLGDQNSGDKINIPSARRASWGVGPDSTILNGFLKTHLLIYFTYLLFQTLQLFVLSYFFFAFFHLGSTSELLSGLSVFRLPGHRYTYT